MRILDEVVETCLWDIRPERSRSCTGRPDASSRSCAAWSRV